MRLRCIFLKNMKVLLQLVFWPCVENIVSLAVNAPQNVQEREIEGVGHCPPGLSKLLYGLVVGRAVD